MSFQVIIQPSKHQFPVEPGQTVLDAALAAGIVLPYSCRNGACSTCKGKVVSGEFDAGQYPAQILSPEELADGYTLFCQARPESDLVVESTEVRLASDIQIRKLPSRVQTMERAAPDVAVLKLQLPASEQFRYYAGQYVEVILKDGRRRSYSMAGAPHWQPAGIAHPPHARRPVHRPRVRGWRHADERARDPAPGRTVRLVLPARGQRQAGGAAGQRHRLCAGQGHRRAHDPQEHPASGVAVLGRSPSAGYMDALAQSWTEALPGFRYVPVVSNALQEDGWTGRTGFVHEAVMQDIADMSGHQVYACGTP